MSEALEIKNKIDQALTVFEQFKNDNEKAIEKNEEKSAEHSQKIEKMAADISEVMVLKQKVDCLESLQNKNVENATDKNAEYNQHFQNFLRKGARSPIERMDFLKYMEMHNLESHALSVDIDSDGGYVVFPQYEDIRKTREFESSPIRQVANVMTISTDRLIIPVDQDEATAGGWTGERATPSDTDTPDIKQIEIPVHGQYAQPKATQKILDDAAINIEQWLGNKITDILNRTENTAFISGNGVAKPKGILSYSAWATNGTYEFDKIEQINSGAAASFTADGVFDLQNSLKEIYQSNAVFLTKRASFGAIMKLKTGDGEYLFNRMLDKNVGTPFSLLGRPLLFANDMQALGANNLAMAYGDFKAGYQIIDRKGIQVVRDPYTSKPYVIFYATKRVGGAVINFEAIKIQKLAV
jgi:HK97 family phage major capsid protein